MDKKIGLSVFSLQSKFGDVKAVEMAKLTGCDCIDLDICCMDTNKKGCIYTKSEDEILTHYDAVRRKADELEIEIAQTHGRISLYSKDNEQFNNSLLENARIDCLVTKTLGAPVTVMHNVDGPGDDPKWMHDKSFELFTGILKHAKKYDVVVATETFGKAVGRPECDFFGYVTEYMKTYNRIIAVDDNAKYFKMCMDTGHTHCASRYDGNPNVADYIRILGKNIVALHLHDNDSTYDQHKMPFMGNIDWNDVFNALDEIGYKGVYNMELTLNKYGDDLMIETGAFAVKILRNFLNERY